MTTFADALDCFVQLLPIRPVLLGNVYDPTLGNDNRNFLYQINLLMLQIFAS